MVEFHWILPKRLAGSGQPGLLDSLETDLAFLKAVGIRHIISLREAQPPKLAERWPFKQTHFPISDMGIPTPRMAASLCRKVVGALEEGEPVLLHCKAGLGRTGTLLACCLITMGMSAEEALHRVRTACPRYIQAPIQEHFLGHYEQFLIGEEGRDTLASEASGGASGHPA